MIFPFNLFFGRSPLPYWFVLIFAPPGNGKSLEQARLSEKVIEEYFRTEKNYPDLPQRVLMTNQKLSLDNFKIKKTPEEIESKIIYWEQPEDIRYCPRVICFKHKVQPHLNHDVDIFVDEGSTLFPADGWSDTPMWLRKMWAQHRHNGIRIVMLTQDYMAIDINCRRMLWQSYYMHKIIGSRDISPTLPPLYPWTLKNFLNLKKQVVWGLYSARRFDPIVMKADPLNILAVDLSEKKANTFKQLKLIGAPQWHLITTHKISLYDTTQNVKEFSPKRELLHIAVRCKTPGCNFLHKKHILK